MIQTAYHQHAGLNTVVRDWFKDSPMVPLLGTPVRGPGSKLGIFASLNALLKAPMSKRNASSVPARRYAEGLH